MTARQMTRGSPVHSSFALERLFDAPPRLVFAAWTEPQMKAAWFIGGEGWSELRRDFDVDESGVEILHGKFEGGPETLYTARYHAVRPDDLLVYAYDMHLDGEHLSTSLATAAFEAAGAKTKMIYTEQAVYLDGEDGSASRQGGVGAQFARLADTLASMESAS